MGCTVSVQGGRLVRVGRAMSFVNVPDKRFETWKRERKLVEGGRLVLYSPVRSIWRAWRNCVIELRP
jgi:hypothetical protein